MDRWTDDPPVGRTTRPCVWWDWELDHSAHSVPFIGRCRHWVSVCFSRERYNVQMLRPCTHWQFYPTRVPFANGSRRVTRVHTASTASGSSGTLRPHQDVFAVDANGSRRFGSAVWMLVWTRRTRRVGCDAPSAHVCWLTYLFPLIQFTWPGKVTYVMS